MEKLERSKKVQSDVHLAVPRKALPRCGGVMYAASFDVPWRTIMLTREYVKCE